MYPAANEKIIIDEAEKLMVKTMAALDPSHDAYHGKLSIPIFDASLLF